MKLINLAVSCIIAGLLAAIAGTFANSAMKERSQLSEVYQTISKYKLELAESRMSGINAPPPSSKNFIYSVNKTHGKITVVASNRRGSNHLLVIIKDGRIRFCKDVKDCPSG